MDSVIGKIVEIFNMEKVELVRLNGLVKYLNNNIGPINVEGAKTIINKLNQAGIIDYEYEITCPACKETSYIIIEKSKGFKTCDTCKTIYPLELNKNLFPNMFISTFTKPLNTSIIVKQSLCFSCVKRSNLFKGENE